MCTVRLKFRTPALEAARKPTCEVVLRHFKLPPLRLLCFFDDENPIDLDYQIGSSYCGVHATVVGSGLIWPSYVDDLFLDFTGDFLYDNIIYINGRTCSSPVATVITLAPELQHFVQYGSMNKIWRANTLIYNILRNGPPTTIRAWEIPCEGDT